RGRVHSSRGRRRELAAVHEGAIDLLRIGVDKEFRLVEAMPMRGVPWSFRPEAIACTRFDAGDEAVMDIAEALRQRSSITVPLTPFIEERQGDAFAITRDDRNIDAAIAQRDADRLRH